MEEKKKKRGRPKVSREKKERITLTLFRSLYDDAQKIAASDGLSMSELVTNYLNQYVSDNIKKLRELEKSNQE